MANETGGRVTYEAADTCVCGDRFDAHTPTCQVVGCFCRYFNRDMRGTVRVEDRLLGRFGQNVPEGDGWSWEWESDPLAVEAANLIRSLRATCQKALEAIAPCVVGWEPGTMPSWAQTLNEAVPDLQAALGIAQSGRRGSDA